MKISFLITGIIFFNIAVFCQPQKKSTGKPPPGKSPAGSNFQLTSPKDLSYLVPPIVLEPAKKKEIKPEKFFIERFEDSSGIKDAGFAILPRDYKQQRIVFNGKPEHLLNNYVRSICNRDTSLTAFVIRLQHFSISEKQLTKADMHARMEFAFDVYFRKEGKLYLLDRFTDTLHNDIYVGFEREYDLWLKKTLSEFIQVLDLLADYAKPETILLPGEKAELCMLTQEDVVSSDTLVLTPQSPLKWTDFTGSSITPDQMLIASSLYMRRVKVIRNGNPVLLIRIEPVMVRNKSWSGFLARNDKLLNNQRYELLLIYWHALKLKKLLDKQVSTAQYSLFKTEMIFYSVAEELHVSRNRYEEETEFGENQEKQKEWENRIRSGIVAAYIPGQ